MRRQISKLIAGLAVPWLMGVTAIAADRQTLRMGVPGVTAQLRRIERLPETNRLRLAIGLPLRNQTALTNLFREIYEPHNPNFHHYLTPEQFTEQFGPTKLDYQTVANYAKSCHMEVVGTYGNRALVDIEGSVGDIENMFQIHLGIYQHPKENRHFFAPDVEPTVDARVPILYVSGLDNYVIPHSTGHMAPLRNMPGGMPLGGSFPFGASTLYAGNDFRNAYAPGTGLDGTGQVLGLYEAFGGYTPSDVQLYETTNGLRIVPLHNVLLDGVTATNFPPSAETVSDIELGVAMAPGLVQVNIYLGTNQDDILNEMAWPSQGEPLPHQISCSTGPIGETNMENALMEMAVQGQAFFVGSGDYGAFIGPDTQSSQYFSSLMTYVGGTQLYMNGDGASWSNEVVWNDGGPPAHLNYFSSTGGILTDVPMPYWQKGVSMTLNHGSTQYRNFPDVAMVARDIFIVATALPTNGPPVTGQGASWVGTSAAAPLWAGYTALVNQQAAAMGKPPVGFLNPAIYALGQGPFYAGAFHDITNGNNAWTNAMAGTGSSNLWPAVAGFDLCTGWGTPAGSNFINAIITYSDSVFVDFNYTGSTQNGNYNTPFNTLAGGTNAVNAGGTIIIKTAGSSSETMNIKKPMTITAIGGPATVGN